MTIEVEPKIESSFLYNVLRVDGIFAAVSGFIIILGADFVAGVMGISKDPVLISGALVLGYGISLLILTRGRTVNHNVAIGAIILNLSWVGVSYLGLLLGWFEVDTAGKWIIVLVAEVVLAFAVLEYVGLRKQQSR